jgi:hypothetical protein
MSASRVHQTDLDAAAAAAAGGSIRGHATVDGRRLMYDNETRPSAHTWIQKFSSCYTAREKLAEGIGHLLCRVRRTNADNS